MPNMLGTPVASAQEKAQEKPLMVIRFDSNLTDYEKNLDKAVKMALKAKSTTFFDVIAIFPETTNVKRNKQFEEKLKVYAEKVRDQIKAAGVSENMIRVTLQQNKQILNNEIQIFVQ